MKIVIAGGTGQIGAILCRAFSSAGDEVVVLSRKSLARSSYRSVQWDGKNLCGWTQELEGANVVINLAGRSVNCCYGKRNRREILESRVDRFMGFVALSKKQKNRHQFGCKRPRQRSTHIDLMHRMMNSRV